MQLAAMAVIGVLSLGLVVAVVYIVRSFIKPRKKIAGQPEMAKQRQEVDGQAVSSVTKALPKKVLKQTKQWAMPILIASFFILFSGLFLWSESNRAADVARYEAEVTKLQEQVAKLSVKIGDSSSLSGDLNSRVKDLEDELGLSSLALKSTRSATILDRITNMELELGLASPRRSIFSQYLNPRPPPPTLKERVIEIENKLGIWRIP